jgi:hypothetical protein
MARVYHEVWVHFCARRGQVDWANAVGTVVRELPLDIHAARTLDHASEMVLVDSETRHAAGGLPTRLTRRWVRRARRASRPGRPAAPSAAAPATAPAPTRPGRPDTMEERIAEQVYTNVRLAAERAICDAFSSGGDTSTIRTFDTTWPSYASCWRSSPATARAAT